MYKHILLPVELGIDNDYADAMAVARKIAEPGARITLIHVVEQVPLYARNYIIPEFETKSMSHAKEELAKVAESFGTDSTAVVLGSPGRSIVDWATENSADCIVVASHKPGLSNLVLGSTATWIVKHSPVALHILR